MNEENGGGRQIPFNAPQSRAKEDSGMSVRPYMGHCASNTAPMGQGVATEVGRDRETERQRGVGLGERSICSICAMFCERSISH